MRCTLLSFVLLASALALSNGISAEEIIYRWADANGTVHFGEMPPPGVNAKPVNIAPAPSTPPGTSPAPGPAPNMPGETTAPLQEEPGPSYAQQRRDERAEKRQAKAAEQEKIDAQCEAMRHQLARTEPNPRVIVRTADGGSRRLDDDERLELVNEARTFIDKNCE